jgi:energy-coupling factor transporter ATP-binding protein EcfA2
MLRSRIKEYSHLVLSGADGSGKTTIAKFLVSVFSGRDSVCFHWFRGSHILASILARIFSRLKSFRGNCNPYYMICVPEKLKSLWVHIEFWSLLPHVFTRFFLRIFCDYLVCDRGFLDFIVWIIATLDRPSFLRSIYGSFLLRLAYIENPVYLYADPNILFKRSDVPKSFVFKELSIYNSLAKNLSLCSIDTGAKNPHEVAIEVLRCLKR